MSEGEAGGMLNLCIPFNVIEPIISKLSSQSWFMTSNHANVEDLKRLKENIQDVPLSIEAYIAETQISAGDLASLKVGDILTTPKLATHKILVNIGNRPKFHASIGQIRGHKAIRIEKEAVDTDKINF